MCSYKLTFTIGIKNALITKSKICVQYNKHRYMLSFDKPDSKPIAEDVPMWAKQTAQRGKAFLQLGQQVI